MEHAFEAIAGWNRGEVGPSHCPASHLMKPPNVQVSGDVAKRTYLCRVCGLQINRRHDDTREWITQEQPG